MGKHLIKSQEVQWVDENGQLQASSTTKELVYKTNEDEFYMVFINFVKWMYGIKSVAALKLLPKLLENAKFNTGEISISSGLRQQISLELGISDSAFSKAIKELVDNKALYPKEIEITKSNGEKETQIIKGEYTVNPTMFWKGDLKNRKELRVVFESKEDSIDKKSNVQIFEESNEF